MSTYKNISEDWYISLNSGNGTIYINGSVDVTGNITTVSELAVDDAFIIVAANNTGTVQDMGLVAQKTGNTFAGLRFDTVANTWQISSAVYANGEPISAYSNIGISGGNTTVAGANTQIQFNDDNSFGASANLIFDKSSNKLVLQGHMALGNIGSSPAATSNAVTLYNKAVGIGGTGLFVVNGSIDDETISATKARLYSIIF